jgi:predicted Zn-dependent peptidase
MVRKHSLPGGITLLYERMPQAATVSFGLYQRVGSVCETSANNGLTHFVEHMLFKGTKRYSARDIAMRIDSVGAAMNAYTTREKTCFYANFLPAHTGLVIDLLQEMYYNSVFPKREITREKQVVLQEISMYEDDPEDQINDRFITQLWPDSSIGYTITGKAENIAAIGRPAVARFFEQHYTTDRLVVSAAGAIAPDEIIEKLSRWPKRISAISVPEMNTAGRGSEAASAPPLSYTLCSQQKKIEQTHLLLAFPGVAKNHPWRVAVLLLNQIWGASMSSRLFQSIREKSGMCYSIYSFLMSLQETGFCGIYSASAPEHLDKILTLIRRENSLLLSRGITHKELAFAKEQAKSSLLIGQGDVERHMNIDANQEIVFGRYLSVREILREIEAVDVDTVRAVIAPVLGEGKCAVRTLGPKPALKILDKHFPGTPHAKE